MKSPWRKLINWKRL